MGAKIATIRLPNYSECPIKILTLIAFSRNQKGSIFQPESYMSQKHTHYEHYSWAIKALGAFTVYIMA